MATIGTLAVQIVLDNHAFTGGLAKSSTALRQFQQSGSGVQSTMAGLGGSMLRFAGVASAGVLAWRSFKAGLDDALGDRTAIASLSTLTKSAEQAEDVWARLEGMGAKSPFAADEFLAPAKTLLAMGESGNVVVDTLHQLGDIAAATGGSMETLATAYGKAMQRGTISNRELTGLIAAGVPIVEQLAKQFGVSAAQVKKLADDGKVGIADLRQAFTELTSEGGKFFGAMEAQANTTGGALKTIKDSLADIAGTIADGLIPDAAVAHVADSLDTLAHGFERTMAANRQGMAEMAANLERTLNPDQGAISAALEAQRLAQLERAKRIDEIEAKNFRPLTDEGRATEATRNRLMGAGFSGQIGGGGPEQLRTIAELMDRIKQQQDALAGVTDEEMKLAPILEGLNEADRERVKLLVQQSEQLEEQARLADELKRSAEQTTAGTRLPIEQFETDLASLQQQLASGQIDQTTFDRALAQQRNRLAGVFGDTDPLAARIGGAGALERGSSSAFSAIADFRRNGNQGAQQKAQRSLDELVRIAEAQRKALDDLAREMREQAERDGVLEVRH